MKTRIVTALLTTLASCGGGGPISDLVGVYALDEWTENESACDAEGPSVLADRGDTALYIKEVSFFGQDFLSADTCVDLATCVMDGQDSTISLSGFAFESGSDSSGWTGRSTFIGGAGDGTPCSGSVTEHELIVTSGGLQITSRRKDVDDVPRDSDGFCSTDAAEDAAEGQPCSGLEVLSATFNQGL